MDKKESLILLNFLKSGLSTRELDRLLGHSDKNGWPSWNILKKYHLKNSDKGKLFIYSTQQTNKIIKAISEGRKGLDIDKLIESNPPSNLKKYKDTYVIAKSEKSFYNIMSGETRNIIRDFFNPKKKLIEECQFRDCTNTGQLDTVHFSKGRPQIFIECARRNKEDLNNGLFKFDVYKTMECFLQGHSKNKVICFLCKRHHNEFHKLEKEGRIQLNKFKEKIIFSE